MVFHKFIFIAVTYANFSKHQIVITTNGYLS